MNLPRAECCNKNSSIGPDDAERGVKGGSSFVSLIMLDIISIGLWCLI